MTRPTIHIAAQNAFYTHPLPAGKVGDVIVLSSHWFLSVGAPGTPDLTSFLGKTKEEVKARLGMFLKTHPEVSRTMSRTIMIDLEDPHPQNLHMSSASQRAALIKAFKTRIAVTREVFPHAKLALYGTLNPDGRGDGTNPTYQARVAALIRAGQLGLYDQLDYLVPILYLRFGPKDSYWNSIGAYTSLGITGSKRLRRSNGTSLALLPCLGLWVANANSVHNQELVLDLPTVEPLHHTLQVQLDILAKGSVRDVTIWVGKDQDKLDSVPNPQGRTVTQHVSSLL